MIRESYGEVSYPLHIFKRLPFKRLLKDLGLQ